MRTKNFLKHLIMCALLLTADKVVGQVSTGSNVASGPTDFLGWDNTGSNNFPLMLRHDLNQPMDFYTNMLQRMRVYETRSGALPLLAGGTVPLRQNGYVAISGDPNFFAPGAYGPFSRLHLADTAFAGEGITHYAQPWGYRSWMKNGVTFTGNHDHGYIGQRYYGHDSTDMVLQWSDNAEKSPFGPDRLRFIFTSDNTGAASGSRSQEGLEFMRMYPVNQNQGWIGVGNFAQTGLFPTGQQEPTERLDILDRTIRLREFATASPNSWEDVTNTFDRVLVVDPSDGRVYWRPESSLTTNAITDCKWTLENEGTSGSGVSHNVYTALGTDNTCPDEDDLVGIGVQPTAGKLHVFANTVEQDVPGVGVFVRLEGDDDDAVQGIDVQVEPDGSSGYNQVGVSALARNASFRNAGVIGKAELTSAITMSQENMGVQGISSVSSGSVTYASGVYGYASRTGGTATNNQGVWGYGNGGTTSYGTNGWATGAATNYGSRGEAWGTGTSYGVQGIATGSGANYAVYGFATGGTVNWAGYFAGDVQAGATYLPSDADLKSNIETLEPEDATEILAALALHTYNYNTDAYPQMHLPQGNQAGLLAQELEAIVPALVKSSTHPQEFDHEGNLLSEAVTFKAVNYVGLIPYLIAGHQAQQAQMQQMEDHIANLEEALSNCCTNMGGGEQRLGGTDGSMDAVSGNTRALTIQPNPFNEQTTLYYTLERSGRMQLMANSADGKQLRVLHEAALEAGQYQHEWHTSDLSPGVYYVTLLLDGEAIVKKAVKVQR